MKITDLLKKEGILLNCPATDRDSAIDAMIELHSKVGNLHDAAEFKKAILAREEKGSTAIGMGIAVPHGKSASVKNAGLTAITIPNGIDYKSLDGNPSNLFFMIAAPDTAADTHLEVLSKLITLLMDQTFAKKLLDSKTADEFLKVIDDKEAEKDKSNVEMDIRITEFIDNIDNDLFLKSTKKGPINFVCPELLSLCGSG